MNVSNLFVHKMISETSIILLLLLVIMPQRKVRKHYGAN